MPKPSVNAIIRTVQGCDGYSMDLAECAEHYEKSENAAEQNKTAPH